MAIRLNFNQHKKIQPSELVNKIPQIVLLSGKNSSKKNESKKQDANGTTDTEKDNKTEILLSELNQLIGLNEVKSVVKELCAYVEVRRWREKEGLNNEPMTLHMLFKGSPGTGKTTVARLLGKLFKELDVLSKGHMIEVERADLVGEYIGHTAIKAREQLKKAQGGILFIDEAYSLVRGGEKDFGRECLDCLVKGMEDSKNDLILILAGYPDEMELFIRSNPGLRSRIPIQINFPDYAVGELMDIAKCMVVQRQYVLSSEAMLVLRNQLVEQMDKGIAARGNARYVRNIIEKAIRRHAARLLKEETQNECSKETLMTIMDTDVREAVKQEGNWATQEKYAMITPWLKNESAETSKV